MTLNRVNSAAMFYANEKATEILESREMEPIRREIYFLFTQERISTTEIASRINSKMKLSPGIKIQTAAGIVRRVVRELVDENLRCEISGELHADSITRNAENVHAAREEWMEEQGYFVWSAEQVRFFEDLICKEEFLKPESRQCIARRKKEGNGKPRPRKRRRPVNHVAVAAALNEKFDTDEFTPRLCQEKLDRIRTEERKRAAKS